MISITEGKEHICFNALGALQMRLWRYIKQNSEENATSDQHMSYFDKQLSPPMTKIPQLTQELVRNTFHYATADN